MGPNHSQTHSDLYNNKLRKGFTQYVEELAKKEDTQKILAHPYFQMIWKLGCLSDIITFIRQC